MFSKQSKIPEWLKPISICNMKNGEEGYVVPWSVFSDSNDNLWINKHFSYTKNKEGTSHVLIKKDANYIYVTENTFESTDIIPPIAFTDSTFFSDNCFPVVLI